MRDVVLTTSFYTEPARSVKNKVSGDSCLFKEGWYHVLSLAELHLNKANPLELEEPEETQHIMCWEAHYVEE